MHNRLGLTAPPPRDLAEPRPGLSPRRFFLFSKAKPVDLAASIFAASAIQAPNALQISRAHETPTNSQPQSASDSFNKSQGWGVGYICWLGAAPLKGEVV